MKNPRVWVAGLLALLIVAPWRTSAGQKQPLTESDLVRLLAGGVYCGRVAMLVRERGIAFSPTKRQLELLKQAGADEELRRAIAAQGTTPGRYTLEPVEARPLIIWHRVDGRWRWHCVAHCSRYRGHHAGP
jgi:hypothetical protein